MRANIKMGSDVTGKVWKIVAIAGTVVGEEGAIRIIESMKVEIGVAAPSAGTVVEVLVSEGDDVLEGQSVARFDRAS